MNDATPVETAARGTVRTLSTKELPLLREHLLRLDPASRHDRFNGFIDSGFIVRYAAKCVSDGTIVVAYFEDGVVRGAAELHQPDLSPVSLPEIAFSVEACVRRKGVGSLLFSRLIEKARALNYQKLRITTGAQNEAMRALAHKFGANLTFRHGESTGSIDLRKPTPAGTEATATPVDAMRALMGINRAWWTAVMKMYGPGGAT
ncbi:MAG: family N-acetyltransferase [Tardiphaga sp.]|jgi:GNAT superfamily N-acetyltransferase|nr:family N-acetyltransferase [Tardiphaga sp.]MDB5573512.1 family N-acetyltransferase [Tardiphaga sp.]MDB5625585.1 family N-acetyltransferase [Tardiphaga sp.]